MSSEWKPHVTVAAVIENDGHFLLVEERTRDGLCLNQPAGHLEPGESLIEACVRETLEETTYAFTPTHLLGTYLWRSEPNGSTYLRFAFVGKLGEPDLTRALDVGIVRTLWLTAENLQTHAQIHRSPLVMQCVRDYLAGQRFTLDLLSTHHSIMGLAHS